MPKKPGKGKAKGLARAKTRPAGKKAKGRPFQAKDARPEKFGPGPDFDAPRDKLDPERFITIPADPHPPWGPSPTRTVIKKAARHRDIVAIGACKVASGMLANPELIEDFDDQDAVKRIITMSIFIAREIHQSV